MVYSLEKKAQEEMVKLFIDFCFIAESGEKLTFEIQDKSKQRYYNRNKFESLKEIPSNADKETIDRYARAFWYPPYKGAYINYNGSQIEVIPEIVKNDLAKLLHYNDLEILKEVSKKYFKDLDDNI